MSTTKVLTGTSDFGRIYASSRARLPNSSSAACAGPPLIQPKGCNVADLPAHLSSPTDAPGIWWVARVRHDQESALVTALAASGVDWCLPQMEQITRYPKRVYTRNVPLFRDYVPFCCRFPGDEFGVLQLRVVCDLIRVVRQEHFVRQLSNVYLANKLCPLDPYPHAVVGKSVKISRGKLAGVRGIVERRDGCLRLVLRVEILGQASVPLEDVEIADVEPDEDVS